MDEIIVAGTSRSSNSFSETDESMDACLPEDSADGEKTEEIIHYQNTLPERSKQRYNFIYQTFVDWCASKNIKKYSEHVLLMYFSELSQKYKPSSLWSIYSMVKATLLIKHNVDIGNYRKVSLFLKKKSIGHVAKKSKVFTHHEIMTFLKDAPDETYLMTKVVLIIGIAGACRTHELTYLTIDNVVDKDDFLIIHIPDSGNNRERTFTVCNSIQEKSIDVISMCRKYFSLRPKNMYSRRLFIKYTFGKCIAQNVGLHTIGGLPYKIASYLNLPNSKNYTGHCFRKTAATLLANSGANIFGLKWQDGWRATTVANDYVDSLTTNEIRNENSILEAPCIRKNHSDSTRQNSENNELSNLYRQVQQSEDPLRSSAISIEPDLEAQVEVNEILNYNSGIPPVRIKPDIEMDSGQVDYDPKTDNLSCGTCHVMNKENQDLKAKVQRMNVMVEELKQKLLQSQANEIKLKQIVEAVKEIVHENIHMPIVQIKQET